MQMRANSSNLDDRKTDIEVKIRRKFSERDQSLTLCTIINYVEKCPDVWMEIISFRDWSSLEAINFSNLHNYKL